MKGPLDRTKVVLRHLPPTITQSQLAEQIDSVFANRYDWLCVRPGKISLKHQTYSRAYIDFKRPEDVIEFAEFFDGHVFVNEKGIQYKTMVEYAPSQRVPKQWSKKDGREGTISKDSEYLEFLELTAKPVENLPSAEIQLERREAERAGAPKDAPIVTALMDFIRQKRAANSGSRRPLSNGKLGRRAGGSIVGNSSPSSSKRGSEKRRIPRTMRYVLRDGAKNTSTKDDSTGVLIAKRDDQQLPDKSVASTTVSGTEALEEGNGVCVITDTGKKKILLLKGKEKDISCTSSGISKQQDVPSPVKNIAVPYKQRREGNGRMFKSLLINKDSRSSQPSVVQSDQHHMQSLNLGDKRPPRVPHSPLMSKDANGSLEDKVVAGNEMHGFFSEKHEKRTRNRDRPDRGVWTLRRSDGSHGSDESLSSSASQPAHVSVESQESYKHGRRGPAHGTKDLDGSPIISDVKSKRGGVPGFASYEKQVWVQKSSSGS